MPVDSPNISSRQNRACVIAKGDSGATRHYWRVEDANYLRKINTNNNTTVMLPNSKEISSTAQGQLPLSNQLSQNAKDSIVLPDLKSSSFIALG